MSAMLSAFLPRLLRPKAVRETDAAPASARIRAPHSDKECIGGGHYTLGYRDENYERWTHVCPNKECAYNGKELEA